MIAHLRCVLWLKFATQTCTPNFRTRKEVQTTITLIFDTSYAPSLTLIFGTITESLDFLAVTWKKEPLQRIDFLQKLACAGKTFLNDFMNHERLFSHVFCDFHLLSFFTDITSSIIHTKKWKLAKNGKFSLLQSTLTIGNVLLMIDRLFPAKKCS